MIEVSFTMVLQWINFAMLVFALTFFLYKPLLKVLDKRRDEVRDELNGAKQKKEEAEEVLKEYHQRLDNLKLEGRKVIDDARRQATSEKSRILDTASQEAKLIIENAQLEIKAHAEEVQGEIKKQAAELIVSCATQVVEREVNEEDHQKYIEEFLNESKS